MWLLQGVGAMELLLLLVASLLLSLSRASRRWMVGVMPCLLIAALLPGPDPLSMLLISIPLVGAFVAGVYLSPRIRTPQPS
jgi:Sec-independent protein secretion pathway component TatC